ncbi:jacalin-like lectin [Paralcaligenes ginsengisoli]
MGGDIESFKMYDHYPPGFVDARKGGVTPIAIELAEDDDIVSAETVNSYLRNVIAYGIEQIPVIGGLITATIGAFWPSPNNNDQLWGCAQNYLNQAIAGVYWQIKYDGLQNSLDTLRKAAIAYVEVPEEDQSYKTWNFRNLYDTINNLESFFMPPDKNPQNTYLFVVPYATLRLATLRENLEHYVYYYGKEPSPETRNKLIEGIQSSIAKYQEHINTARDNILLARKDQIMIREEGASKTSYLIDLYNGYRDSGYRSYDPNCNNLLYLKEQYSDQVLNKLALTLDTHNAIGQLWKYFDPNASTEPITPPTLNYAVGPYGAYQNVPTFSQTAESGSISRATLWTGTLVDALELTIDGAPQGRVGSTGGGGEKPLELAQGERIVSAKGYETGLINALGFTTSTGQSIYGGESGGGWQFDVQPLENTSNTRLTGLSGYAGTGSASDKRNNIKAITFHWECDLSITREEGSE